MENYDERLKKIHDEKEERMKTAAENLLKDAFAKYDEMNGKVKALWSEHETPILINDALDEAESYLQNAVNDFNKGDFKSTVSHAQNVLKIYERVNSACEVHKKLPIEAEGFIYSSSK